MIEPTCWTPPFLGTRFGKNKWSQSPGRTAHRLQQEVPIWYLMVKWDNIIMETNQNTWKVKTGKYPHGLPKPLLATIRTKLLPSWTQTLYLDIGRNERKRPDRDLNFDLNKYSGEIGLKNIRLAWLRILFLPLHTHPYWKWRMFRSLEKEGGGRQRKEKEVANLREGVGYIFSIL